MITQPSTELTLADVFKVLKIYWVSILISPFIFTLLTLLVTSTFVEPKYQAQAVVDIGQVNGVLLESPDVLVDRLNNPSFINYVVVSHPELFTDGKELFKERDFKDFVAKKNKDSGLVTFTLTASTPELARVKAKVLIDSIQMIHEKVYDDYLSDIGRKIHLIEAQLDLSKRQHLNQKLLNSITENPKATIDDSLKFSENYDGIELLIYRKIDLESGLMSSKNFNTKLLEDIYVTENPVSPNLFLITLNAFLLALFCMLFYAFARNSISLSNM